MKKEYIGGRFPKRIKDIIQERANGNGQSMNEYLEVLLTNVLDNDGDGQVQESQYNELLARLEEIEVRPQVQVEAIPFLDPSTGIVSDLAPLEENDSDEEETMVEESELDIISSDEEPIPAFDTLASDAFSRLTPMLLGELSAEISATWSSMNGTTNEPQDKTLIVDFFENLAENLTDKAAAPRKFPRNGQELLSTLPQSYQAEIMPIIEAAISEFKGDISKERFFKILADLLNDAADRLYIESRAFEIVLTRAEYAIIGQMLDKTNKRREKPLVDLQSWIFYKLGEALEDAGDGGVFGRDNAPMLELAKMMMERGENRLTAKK